MVCPDVLRYRTSLVSESRLGQSALVREEPSTSEVFRFSVKRSVLVGGSMGLLGLLAAAFQTSLLVRLAGAAMFVMSLLAVYFQSRIRIVVSSELCTISDWRGTTPYDLRTLQVSTVTRAAFLNHSVHS